MAAGRVLGSGQRLGIVAPSPPIGRVPWSLAIRGSVWTGRVEVMPVPWEGQVRSRLTGEFVARVSVEDITAGIAKARAELDSVPTAALPELVERLVRFRLRATDGPVRGGPTAPARTKLPGAGAG